MFSEEVIKSGLKSLIIEQTQKSREYHDWPLDRPDRDLSKFSAQAIAIDSAINEGRKCFKNSDSVLRELGKLIIGEDIPSLPDQTKSNQKFSFFFPLSGIMPLKNYDSGYTKGQIVIMSSHDDGEYDHGITNKGTLAPCLPRTLTDNRLATEQEINEFIDGISYQICIDFLKHFHAIVTLDKRVAE